MQDKQNKGIGKYKDRPGYFWGGVVGGAILGALVNKMQGKDVARGAMWGGITGGLGSAFVGTGSTAAGTGWLDKMAPGLTKSMFTMGSGNPALFGSILGGGAAWMAGDPKKDRSDYEAWMEEEEAKRRAEQKKAYKYWHTNPWATGGMINARPGYYNGGGAWSGVASDEDVPGSEQDKIMSITGQGGIESLGGLEDIMDTFEMSSGPGQGDLSGWHEMFLDLQGKGEIPGDWDFNDFMENLGALDISPTDFSAQGGYKTRPQYHDAGPVNIHPEMEDEDDEKRRMLESVFEANLPTVSPNPLEQIFNEARFNQAREKRGDDRIMVDDLKERLLANNIREAMARRNPMAFRAEGGIADLDMTGGGASFGPGTGTSDDIPAMLSDGEFVVTANAVKNLGGGDRMLGAKKMYSMMNQLDPDSQTPAEMSAVGRT